MLALRDGEQFGDAVVQLRDHLGQLRDARDRLRQLRSEGGQRGAINLDARAGLGKGRSLEAAGLEALFGKGYALTEKRPVSQPGQYVCREPVDLHVDTDEANRAGLTNDSVATFDGTQ